VNRTSLDGGQRILDESGFIQGVSVNSHLHVVLIGHRERGIDGCRRCPPVFVQLQADGAGDDLFHERFNARRVALAEKSKVERKSLGSLEHPVNIPLTRCARRSAGSVGGAGPAADHGGDAAVKRFPGLLRTYEMDVGVDSARREDAMFSGDDFSGRANLQPRRHTILDIRVAGFADRRDTPITHPHVGFDDAPVVENDRVRDDEIRGARGACCL
jgi:hypothetical protein